MDLTMTVIVPFMFIELILMCFMFICLIKKIEKIEKESFEKNEAMLDNLKHFVESMLKEDAKRIDAYRKMCSQYDKLTDIFEAFTKYCKGLKSQYDIIDDHFQKTLTVWGKIEDRYSDAYEQLKHNDEKFQELSRDIHNLMADWSDVMNDMTIWFENHPEDNYGINMPIYGQGVLSDFEEDILK